MSKSAFLDVEKRVVFDNMGATLLFFCHGVCLFNWVEGESFSSLCSLSSFMLSKHIPSNISKALLPMPLVSPWDAMGRENSCEISHLIRKEHF